VAALPALVAAKVELYRALRSLGVSPFALAQRLGWRPGEVERLLDLDHPSSLAQLEAAFLALGKRLTIDIRDAA
jgi:antitoxin HicB